MCFKSYFDDVKSKFELPVEKIEKTTSKMKITSKIRTTSKMKTTSKLKMNLKNKDNLKTQDNLKNGNAFIIMAQSCQSRSSQKRKTKI